MTYRLFVYVAAYPLFKLDLRSGREVHFKDLRRRRRSSLPTVLLVPEDLILMTPPPPPGAQGGTPAPGSAAGTPSTKPNTGNAAASGTAAGQGTAAGKGAAGAAGAAGTAGTSGTGTKSGTSTSGTTGSAGGSSRGAGAIPKNNTTGTSAPPSSVGPPVNTLPPVDPAAVLQITPAMLQQLLSSAIAASSSSPREPPVPKFWESEPAAWFQVFRGHYQPRNLTQLALFNALLPLVPTSAVTLCRPFVGSTAPDVFDRVERLLLQRFEMSQMERGKALLECTSLGDKTPEEMLQHMRSLQPGEEEGTIFRYLFVSLLPDVVREVVATMDSLDAMAKTANSILQLNAAARISALAVSIDDLQVSAVRRPPPPRPARGTGTSSTAGPGSLCRTHTRYGQDAFRCDKPSSCPMRSVVRTPGNGSAGRR